MRWLKVTSLTLFILIFILSCSNEENFGKEGEVRKEYKIAVVLPQDTSMEEEWRNVIGWALDNINASLIRERGIKLTTEWIEEVSGDKKTYKQLADREDISVILGPLYSENAYNLVSQCLFSSEKKAIIPATTSSVELMRSFANDNLLWCLTENDISQAEILINLAKQKGAKNISLLTSDDKYGESFSDWFGFLSKELDMNLKGLEIYKDQEEISGTMKRMLEDEEVDCLICVPSHVEYARKMRKVQLETPGARPFILYSDVAYIMSPDSESEGMEGVVQSHDPESGFGIAYEVRYGRSPGFGVSQYYDAVMLAGLALLDADIRDGNGKEDGDINACMRRIVSGEGTRTDWTAEGISQAVACVVKGEYPSVRGCSGKLTFDPSVYTNVIHSVYSHWQVYAGKHIVLEYSGTDDSGRASTNVINWNRKGELLQDFDKGTSIQYPPKEGVNAIIISTSSGWDNYRHQADAYAMYQLLLQKGFSKENIILIAEDDIANNPGNPIKGEVRNIISGPDVYNGIQIDYKPSQINYKALSDILGGVERPGLSRVIHSKENDNLFIYWVGHGMPAGLNWLSEVIPAVEIAGLFGGLATAGKFRKAFFAIEACYGGKVGEYCQGIPGLLCMSSANANEMSQSCNYSTLEKAWLSNFFSEALMGANG